MVVLFKFTVFKPIFAGEDGFKFPNNYVTILKLSRLVSRENRRKAFFSSEYYALQATLYN